MNEFKAKHYILVVVKHFIIIVKNTKQDNHDEKSNNSILH